MLVSSFIHGHIVKSHITLHTRPPLLLLCVVVLIECVLSAAIPTLVAADHSSMILSVLSAHKLTLNCILGCEVQQLLHQQ